MGKEELKTSIQQKEAALTGVDFETQKEEVEGEKGVVDENKVHEAIGAIEKRIAGSSLSDRFKQKLTEKLSESTNHWQKRVDVFRTKQAEEYKEKFKALFDQVLDAFAKFDERPEVKEIFEVVEPFFENARQIKAIINLDAYKRRSSDWKKLNDRLALIGIDSGKIRGIQKILHVKVDGKLGPETINALNREIYEQEHEVKWSDEETRHKAETPEQFGERAVEAGEILDSEGWKSLEKETERQLADLEKRYEGVKTLDDIKRFEREEARIIMTTNQAKQRYIDEFRARKEEEARAASAERTEAVGSTDNATGAKAAPGAVAVESPVVAQAQKPSESREEKEAIEAAFTRITGLFAGWGIPVATQSYISAYKAFSKEKRIPFGQIEGHFHKITVAAQGSKGNPDQVIRSNQKEIIKALGQFVNGVGGEGIRTVDHVIAQILDDHKFAETMPEYTELERGVVEKEHALKQSAEVFMSNLMGNGKSRPGHEDDRENYRVAYMGLIDSLHPLVVIREKFSDRFRERQDSVTVANFVPAPDEHGKVKPVFAPIPMPDTIKQYEELHGRFEAAFLTERRLYYIATGDSKYKAAFDESQQRMTDQLRGETSAALDEAGEEDKKPTGLESADAEALKIEVSSVIDSIVTEFDQLQRLQAADAMAAYHGSVGFHKKLLALKNKNPSGTKIDFAKLAKLPNVHETFFRIVDTYDEQTTYLTVQAISQNRDVVRYQELYQDFMNQTGLFLRQVNSVYDHLKKTGEEPTELTMQDMHRWVGEIRNHPFFQNSNRYPGSRFADLKYMEIEPGSDYSKYHNLALMGVKEMVYGRNMGHEGDHIGARDYLNMVNTLGGQMLQMQGEAATFKTFVKQTGKEVAVLTAAVAGAVAMGALVAATGGLAGAGIAVVAGNLAIGAVCTGLGAAIGAQYSRAIIEGTSDHITTTAMLKAWGVGSAFSFAAGAGGTVLGTTFGRAGAAMARGSGALSQRAADAARKMGEKMVQAAKVPGAATEKGLKTQLSHLLKEFAQETREEVIEDSLQKIGEGIAPEHPWLGFTLSIIPHTSRTARATFMKSNWSFSPASGVTAQITDGGLHMKYNDVASVRAFLEQKGAPAEALAQLDDTGVVDVQAEGMRIKIEPTSEPVDARLLLVASASSRARELEGVKFDEDTGQYECADTAAAESFVHFFQSEGYIILEQNADGSVVLERAGETVRLAAAPTVKVETEPDPEIVNEIKDPDLRQKVKDLVRDMWIKTTQHFENAQYIENLRERFREIGPALKKANLGLYHTLSERLATLRMRFQKVDGIFRGAELMTTEEILGMEPEAIRSYSERARGIDFARKLFGIEGELTDAKIRQAYRELSLKFHPDRHGNAEQATEMFKLISEAKSTLERALVDGQVGPVEEVRDIGPGRFEIWSKQITEWMDARIAEISDLQLRQRVSSLVADMRQAGSDMTDTVWRRVSEGWLRVGAELRTANEALWKRVDEGMQKLRVMRETFEATHVLHEAEMKINTQLRSLIKELKGILPSRKIKQLLDAVNVYEDSTDSLEISGYSASVLTTILSKAMPNDQVRLSFGLHVDKWGNAIPHYFTVINNQIFIDLTYDQFDGANSGALIGKVDDLRPLYGVIMFDGINFEDYRQTIKREVKAQDHSSLLHQFKGTLQELTESPDATIVPYDRDNSVKVAQEQRIQRMADAFVAGSKEFDHIAQETISPLLNADEIVRDAYDRAPQFKAVDRLLREVNFKVRHSFTFGDIRYHFGEIIQHTTDTGKTYLYCLMMYENSEGVLYPRIVYKSTSGGGWRSTPGASGDVYSKGKYHREAYAIETRIDPVFEEYLDSIERVGASRILEVDPIRKYFDLFDPIHRETVTYNEEVIKAPESDLLGDFTKQGYIPGKLTADNVPEYFASLDGSFPSGFIPDFSRGPIQQRERVHAKFGRIVVETYKGKLGGREVEWDIAYEHPSSAGNSPRVWIEAISISPRRFNSYGTQSEVLISGLLTHKPAEYIDQATGLSEGVEGIRIGDGYYDITPVLDNLRPIREFRDAKGFLSPHADKARRQVR